jgi:hypothetical protein
MDVMVAMSIFLRESIRAPVRPWGIGPGQIVVLLGAGPSAVAREPDRCHSGIADDVASGQ